MSSLPKEFRNLQQEHPTLVERGKRGFFSIVFGRTMLIIALLLVQCALVLWVFYRLTAYIPYYFGSVVILTVGMLIYQLNTRSNPAIKLTWCVIIALVPVVGTALYFFIHFDLGHRVEQAALQKAIKDSAPFVPEQKELMAHLKETDRDLHNLALYTLRNGGYPVYENTAVTYFPLGEDKFREMLRQLEQAEKFIFLEYFLINEGYLWDKVLEILRRKVSQGVEVRVLYDGTCAIFALPYGYPKRLEAMGIRCKMFSPARPFVSTHYNNRDHRKILVIDGRVAFTGGINISDRYINREVIFGHWKDTAVMLEGEAVQSFTRMFLQMWNATERHASYAPYLRPSPPAENAPGYVIPYGDSPLDNENVGEMVYLNILNQARDYVYIMSPYLIVDNEMKTALCFASQRGVDVRIVLPHVPDKKYAFVLAQSHYKELTEAGVKIYEYTPGFVHAKVFVCDDREAVVGTINLDYRSLYLHFECAAYLHSVPAIADIKADFFRTMEQSELVTAETIRHQKLLDRLAAAVLKVAAPLM